MAGNEIEQALQDSNFATKEDLEALSKEVDALVKQLMKGSINISNTIGLMDTSIDGCFDGYWRGFGCNC